MKNESATMRVGVNYATKHLTPQVNFRIRKIRHDGSIVEMMYRPIEPEKSSGKIMAMSVSEKG